MTTDINGNELKTGDSAYITKDLKVKGMSKALKRGDLVKSIKLTDDENSIEAKVNGSVLVIKTEFLKKK